MTTTTHTVKPEGDGIPAGLDRSQNGVQPANVTAAAPAKAATLTSTPPTKAKPVKAAAPAKKPAKAAKAKAAKAKAEGDETPRAPRSIVPARYKEKYAEHNDTCGSRLSLALKELTVGKNKDGRDCLLVKELFAIAKENEIDVRAYADLNNGQKRMNVYNRMVGRLNAGKDVRIGKTLFKASDWTPTTTKKPAAKSAKSRGKAKPQAEHRAAA